jgi:hypothetical protein
VLLRHRHFYARLELQGGHGGVDRGAPRVEEEGLGTGAAARLLEVRFSFRSWFLLGFTSYFWPNNVSVLFDRQH